MVDKAKAAGVMGSDADLMKRAVMVHLSALLEGGPAFLGHTSSV